MLKNLASYELRELDWYFTSIGFYIKPLKAKLQGTRKGPQTIHQ